MAVGDYIEEELRNALQLLELANLEAIRAKQQLGRIIGEDFQVGAEIRLIPSVFWIEGARYRAMVTHEQRDAILHASGGSTQSVINVVAGMLNNELYLGAYMALQFLVLALSNRPLPKIDGPQIDQSGVQTHTGYSGIVNPIGACMFPTGVCSEPYGATLCESQGGSPQPNCTQKPPPFDHSGGGGDGGA